MRIKLFFIVLLIPVLLSCEKKEKSAQPQGSFNVHEPQQSDREPNGGMLRFTLAGKAMHDNYFVAQFTPRGDVFKSDNLQLYNYNLGSDKFPQFIINIDYSENNLQKWQEKTFPMDFLLFTPAPQAPPMTSRGDIRLTKITDNTVEGTFSGELMNPKTQKWFPIKGEFKAVLKVNV